MRASDRDREASAAALRAAYVRGELSTETLDWRVEAALAARTREQLRRLTHDVALPALARIRRWMQPPPPLPVVALAEVTLGRDAGCDVHFGDRSVSRRHARLRRDAAGWRIEDLGSTNGTWLRGRPVTSARVRPGDVVFFGEAAFRLGAAYPP